MTPALWRLLVQEIDALEWTGPKTREELVAALLAARAKLRRRLLTAEGVDTESERLLG